MRSLLQDVRYGLRVLRRSPGFTAFAVITLAIGIGVNVALFATFNAIALKPLPVKDPANVVRLIRSFASGAAGDIQYAFSYPEYVGYRDGNHSLAALIAVSWRQDALLGARGSEGAPSGTVPEAVQLQFVSANYFSTLGANAVLGRTFLPEDDSQRAAPIVVLSYPCWKTRFNSDADILGRVLKVNDVAVTVAGVAPPDFIGTANPPEVPDVWAPLGSQPQLTPDQDWLGSSGTRRLQLLARLASGTKPAQAEAEINVLTNGFAQLHPENDKTVSVSLRKATYLGETSKGDFRAFVALLMTIVGMVLVVACANLANLLLARGLQREREIGVRLALGATNGRVIRQLLTESTLIGLFGGTAGLLLSIWGSKILWLKIAPLTALFGIDSSVVSLSLDARVLVYAFFLSVATGVAIGFSPALRLQRFDLVPGVRQSGIVFGAPWKHSRMRRFLLGAQATLSVVLVVTAGLLVRGMLRAQTTEPGFDSKQVSALRLGLANDRVKANAMARRVIDGLNATSAVESSGLVLQVPMTGTWTPPVLVEETHAAPHSLPTRTLANYASAGYFPTMGIPIVWGRNFTERESETGAPVAIISESTARSFWPDESPLGKKLKLDRNFDQKWAEFEVVGVVRDVRGTYLSRVDPTYVYVPTNSADTSGYSLMIRTRDNSETTIATVRSTLEAAEGKFLPGFRLTTLADGPVRNQRMLQQVFGWFAGILAALALGVASTGIYGAMAYTVTERTHEIGIRMALGAGTKGVLQWVLEQGIRSTIFGAILGLVLSVAISALLHAILYFPGAPDLAFGVGMLDPAVFIGLPAFLIAVALAACYIPARRATRVEPVVALRCE